METRLHLQMFAEGGEGGAGATGGEAGQSQQADNAENPLADVVYGKQEAEPQTEKQAETRTKAKTADERKAAFEELIKGEYKAEFAEKNNAIFNERFKEHKANTEKLNALQPLLDAVSIKYGVEAGDVEGMLKALNDDDSYFEDEAERQGVTVQQLKQMRRLERENAEFKAAMEQRQKQEQAANVYARWQQEADTVKQVYGSFDLQNECRNPETGRNFLRLLQNGIDVRTAYEVVHKDELLSGAIHYAVQATQKRTMDNIRAKGMRPQENGAGGSVATQVVKSDPSKWTDNDLEEVLRRVKEGKKINL